MIKYLFLCFFSPRQYTHLQNLLSRRFAMHEQEEREGGSWKRLSGRRTGRKAAEGRADGRGILGGWKSIPLDGVTSRAQLAPARVSFRRGFRIYCLSLTGVFCQRFRFFVDSYIHITCMMRWLHLSHRAAAPVGSPSAALLCPRESSSSFIQRALPPDPPSSHYPIP